MTEQLTKTPSSLWKTNDEQDPHGTTYECERAKLCMGNLTDDEVAYNIVVYGDKVITIEELLEFKKTGKAALTGNTYREAAKDRIRWLSRSLDKEVEKTKSLENEIKLLREELDKYKPIETKEMTDEQHF